MNSPPDEVYAIVRDTDPDVLDADRLAEYTGHVAELVAWCEARQVRATRRQRAAGIIPVVLNGAGVVLDQGRVKRLATAEQRMAIEAMQQTCSHPDCTVTIDDCRIHHIDPWQAGGRTDLARMAPLCEPHHHLVHEGGWRFDMTADRVATWTRSDGVVHWSGPLIDRRPDLVAAGR